MVYKKKIYKYRKPHRYKRKKSIFRKRFFWLGILAFVVFWALFYFLYFSAVFQVEKIIVTGEDKVSKEEIESLVEERLENKVLFIKTKSIFALDLGRIRRDILDNFPQIAEVEVGRGFFDAVNVLVIERWGVALWCQEENCFLLDIEGIIFELVSEAKPALLLIETKIGLGELGERIIEQELLSQILEIKSKLQENLKISITEASLISEERLDVKTAEGWQIYFNLKGDLNWQITELGLVLEKQIPPECNLARERGELEYIDLRFSRVYCK